MDEIYHDDAYPQAVPQTSHQPLCSFEQEISNLGTQSQQQVDVSLPYLPVPPQILVYQQQAALDHQNKSALIWAQEEARLHEHWAKQKINEESKIRVEKAKADIQIKKGMLSDTVFLTEKGSIIRKQEYLMERSIEYSFANFSVDGRPIRYVTEDCSSAVLCLRVILQGRGERVLFLDLEEDRAVYYRKKFRRAGIEFKKKRSDKKEIIFDIVQVLDQAAEIVTLPLELGFYRTRDQSLHYAGRKALLWKEVKKHAL